MSSSLRRVPIFLTLLIAVLVAALPRVARAQSGPDDSSSAQHDMQHMHDMDAMSMPPSRDASGTSWLPDDSPMYAMHHQVGAWTLMTHANAFVQYLFESGDRGATQFGSINWFMGMADRTIGRSNARLVR